RESVYEASNDTAAVTMIFLLLCPSDQSSGPKSNYAGCHHDVNAAIDRDNRGVLYLNSRVRLDEITDGTANTILLGEILGGPSLGWISGTRSTLRNTGVPINALDPLRRLRGLGAGRSNRARREERFEIVGSLAEEGSWPVDAPGGFASYHGSTANF